MKTDLEKLQAALDAPPEDPSVASPDPIVPGQPILSTQMLRHIYSGRILAFRREDVEKIRDDLQELRRLEEQLDNSHRD